MKKFLLYVVCSFFSTVSFAQIIKQGEKFTDVFVIEGKVTFLKEVQLKKGSTLDANYKIMKDWAKTNYGKDPFISSVRYDTQKHEFIAKSRIELLLPPNSQGIREKMIMRYRVDGFMYQDKCVLEISDLVYLCETQDKSKLLPKVIRAEDFITDEAIEIRDNLQELRINTRKSTLYFLNELTKDFVVQFGY